MRSDITCARCFQSLALCTCPAFNTIYSAVMDNTTTNVQPRWIGPSAFPEPAQFTTHIDSTAYVNISPADLDKIRTLVHEEIEKALMDEEDNYEPRVVVIDGKPKIHIEFEYEGQLYAGDAYAVEKKYD